MIAPEEKIDKDDADAIIQRLEDSLKDHVILKKDVKSGLISDLFDRQILSQLESSFSSSRSGQPNSLTALEFRAIISQYIPSALVENVYRAIDVNDLGFIKYSDFTNYLIASEAGSSFSARTFISKLVPLFAQEDDSGVVHRDMIDCLVYTKRPCPMFISGGRDGQLMIWDPEQLDLITRIDHRDKNSIYQEELEKSMDTMVKAQSKKKSQNANKPPTKMAITAMCCLLNWGLLCVGSADGCITVYELANQEVCGRITDFETFPTAVDCFQLSHSIMVEAADGSLHQQGEETTSFLTIGDSKGMIHVVTFHPEFGGSSEVGSKKKNQILFAESIKDLARFVAHKDWISDMHFIGEVNALLTASVDCTIAFSDINRKEVTKVFKGHEGSSTIGIKSFDWSPFAKYVISGAERVLLLWDPYTLEVMGKLDNLRSPVITVEVSDVHQKIFATLINKNILVWHNITLELLQVLSDTTLYKPMNTMASMKFVAERAMLFTAGNRITAWSLERAAESASDNEEEDLVTVLYNSLFNQVLMVKSLGTLKIYQAETGEIARQFCILPVDSRTTKPMSPIKDPATGLFKPMLLNATLDQNLSRLIVSNADMSIQFWNIHDGTNLLQFHPQLYSSSLSHIFSSMPKVITCLAYDLLVHKHENDQRKQVPPQKVLISGTDLGHVCFFHECQGMIEEVPMSFLRLMDGIEANETFGVSQLHQHRALSLTSLNSDSTGDSSFIAPSAPTGPAPSTSMRRGIDIKGGSMTSSMASGSTEGIIWVKLLPAPGNSPQPQWLFVGYMSGRVVVWNPENNQKLRDVSTKQLGVSLYAMRLKGAAAAAAASLEQRLQLEKIASQKEDEERKKKQNDHSFQLSDIVKAAAMKVEEQKLKQEEERKAEEEKRQAELEVELKAAEELKKKQERTTGTRRFSSNTMNRMQRNTNKNSVLLALPPVGRSSLAEDGGGLKSTLQNSRMEKIRSLRAAIVAGGAVVNRSDVASKGAISQISEEEENDEDEDFDEEANDFYDDKFDLSSKLNRPQSRSTTITPSNKDNERRESEVTDIKKPRGTLMQSMDEKMKRSILLMPHRSTEVSAMPIQTVNDYHHLQPEHVDSAAITLRKHSSYFLFTSDLEDTEEVSGKSGYRESVLDGHRKVSITGGRIPRPPLAAKVEVAPAPEPHAIVKPSNQFARDSIAKPNLARRWSTQINNPLIAGTPLTGLEVAPQGGFTEDDLGVDGGLDSSVSTLSLHQPPTELQEEIGKGNSRKSIRFNNHVSQPFKGVLNNSSTMQNSQVTSDGSTIRQDVIGGGSSVVSSSTMAPDKVVVDCVTVLPNTKVLIGGCSDRILRIWDMDTCEVLCSSPYIPAGANIDPQDVLSSPIKRALANAPPDELLRKITVSDSEDVIVGAYDNGTIRVWGVHAYSISTLRNLLNKHLMNVSHQQSGRKKTLVTGAPPLGDFGVNTTLAISPLSLISEWSAHVCPILAMDYVWFDYEPKNDSGDAVAGERSPTRNGSKRHAEDGPKPQAVQGRVKRTRNGDMGNDVLEGYILSAGLDQKVYLWSLAGKCVGEFGSFGWDINDERTWLVHPNAASSSYKKAVTRQLTVKLNGKDKKKGPKLGPKDIQEINSQVSTNKSSSNNVIRASPSAQFLQNFWHQKKSISSKDMNRYVEELTKRIVNRPPVYHEVDAQLRDVMKTHPIINAKPLPKKSH